MVDAENITDYNLSTIELQKRIIFWVLAAGKSGKRAASITNQLIYDLCRDREPFKILSKLSLDEIIGLMQVYGTGCHNSKGRSVYELANANLNLTTCSTKELEKIYGVGRKTSRCFIMHSRPNAQCAGLDTHILKFLDIIGVSNVPKSTPSSKKEYERLEKEFLTLAKKYGRFPAELDLEIWNEFSIGD